MLPVFWITWSAVTLLAFIPRYSELPEFVSFNDLLNHAVAFFTLTILLAFAYSHITFREIIFYLLFYAIMIEAVQYFLPTRHASLSDIVADSTGLFIALLLIKRLRI